MCETQKGFCSECCREHIVIPGAKLSDPNGYWEGKGATVFEALENLFSQVGIPFSQVEMDNDGNTPLSNVFTDEEGKPILRKFYLTNEVGETVDFATWRSEGGEFSTVVYKDGVYYSVEGNLYHNGEGYITDFYVDETAKGYWLL